MIDPKTTCLWIPSNLKRFKLDLFNRIGSHIQSRGGRIIRGDIKALCELSDEVIPITGCNPELREVLADWRHRGRKNISWDRGYARRVFATWLPRGENGGYYRWHVNSFQLRSIRDVSSDRWDSLKIPLVPWRKNGKHVVVAAPTPNYTEFHALGRWLEDTLRKLSKITDRQIIVRQKDSKRSLQDDLEGAHCLVACGSIAAVEALVFPSLTIPEARLLW